MEVAESMAETCSQDLILVIEDEWFTVNTTKKATDNEIHKFESALTIGLKKKGERLSSAATSAGVYKFSRRPRLDMLSHRGDSREHALWRRQDHVFICAVNRGGPDMLSSSADACLRNRCSFPLQGARSHRDLFRRVCGSSCVWLVFSRLSQPCQFVSPDVFPVGLFSDFLKLTVDLSFPHLILSSSSPLFRDCCC